MTCQTGFPMPDLRNNPSPVPIHALFGLLPMSGLQDSKKQQGSKQCLQHRTSSTRSTRNLCSCRTVVISIRRSRLVQRRSSKQKIATITLFHFAPNGRLHPLAILIDRRCSIADSVTILNKRLTPLDPESSNYEYHLNQETQDWPWRYTKTCAQVSDWFRHELNVHLENTYMVEEVMIVAANRVFPVDRAVFK